MIKESIKYLELIYEKKCTKEKNIIKNNFLNLLKTLYELWGVKSPKSFIICISDSMIKYYLYTYPFFQKLIILIIYPFWYLRTRKISKRSGVFNVEEGIASILIKSYNFLELVNVEIGSTIFLKSKNIEERYLRTFIGLLSGAVLYKLKLPVWLCSGIITVTNEKYFNKKIVKQNLIEVLSNIKSHSTKVKELAYIHVKGYWTVRYLEENYPGFLKEIFKKYKGEEIVEQIILKLGLDSDNYWEQLGELLYENYKHLLEK